MPKYIITPKVDHLFGANLPEGVDQAKLASGEFDSLEQATAVATGALKSFPTQPRVVSEIISRLSANVDVSVAAESAEKASK